MDATYDRELIAEMLAAAAHGGIHLFAMDAVMGQIAALRAADNRDAAGVDADEDAYVIDRLAHLLAEISVIVNGPEPAGTKWSYHDLPAKVAALAAQQAVAVPEGFVLVPRKANGNMIHAAVRVWDSSSAPDPEQLQVASETWNAMLSAAPTPQKGVES